MENQTNPTTVVRLFPICAPCARGEGSECHTPECALFLRDVPNEGLILEFAQDSVPADTDDGQANACRHDSASGIDTTPVSDPGKVWRCDHCGLRWTDSDQPSASSRYRLAWRSARRRARFAGETLRAGDNETRRVIITELRAVADQTDRVSDGSHPQWAAAYR